MEKMMMKKLNKKLFFAIAMFAFTLNSGMCDSSYELERDSNKSAKQAMNDYMNADFIEIVRFDAIGFDDGIKESSKETLDKAIEKIKSYIAQNKKIHLTIVGHTRAVTDDINEKSVDSKVYANRIQNLFRESFDSSASAKASEEYATQIQKILIDNNISKAMTSVEYRRSDDLGFSDETKVGKSLSNRVMLTMYVFAQEDGDEDEDGVLDYKDKCLKTPFGVKVDKRGCPLDGDRDNVADYKDECPNSPIAAEVNEKGCPFDGDQDGAYDYMDQCPETPLGFEVDVRGCPLKSTLKLLFKTNSDKILEESSSEVRKFAEFLKKNKLYGAKITGHTDAVGKATSNMILSQKRAENAKAALVNLGVEESRISASGRGELDPIQSNRTKEGRSANRRIEVELSY
jgi:outer membrane protein OmpA-like peptidoglycan-associated protein